VNAHLLLFRGDPYPETFENFDWDSDGPPERAVDLSSRRLGNAQQSAVAPAYKSRLGDRSESELEPRWSF
jgi:hypothetical protein